MTSDATLPADPPVATPPAADGKTAWGPPGKFFGAACVLLWLWSLALASSDDFLGLALLFFASGGLLLAWLVRALITAVATRLRISKRHVLRWIAVPAGFGLVWVLILGEAPANLRFIASRPWMDQAAADVAAGGSTEDRWIGLWPATGIERLPGGMRFVVSGAGFLDAEGYAYSADGNPSSIDAGDTYSTYVRIDDHWFHWYEAWD